MSGVESLLSSLVSVEVTAAVPLITFAHMILSLIASYRITDTEDLPKRVNVTDGQTFDFIIVGGGSAGCVIASRLSEIADWSVLLIEAGEDPTIVSKTPGLFPLIPYTSADWGFSTVDDGITFQAHKSKNLHITRGKMLGGTGGANFMLYTRGNRDNYDDWAAMGNDGWNWDNVTEYFKKSENLNNAEILDSDVTSLHGTDGYLGVTRPYWDNMGRYLEALSQDGREILVENNGEKHLGYAPASFTINNRIRQSTATTFLGPAKDRPNLYVLRNTLVTKIIIDKNLKATGVEAKDADGNIFVWNASKEVILSAGAINTPQLLMLSGVGPKTHLEDFGIKVLLDSSNVGQNLQDHLGVSASITGEYNPATVINNVDLFTNLDKFPTPCILGFESTNKSSIYPEYEVIGFPFWAGALTPLILCSYVFNIEDKVCLALTKASLTKETFLGGVVLLNPKSRGQIQLKSSDPEDAPLIYHPAFSNDEDLENLARYLEDYLTLVNTPYFQSVNSEIVNLNVGQCEHLTFASHEYWKCFILNTATTLWHPVGTCAMGPKGVLDETLKVRGITSLRVADGSVMPKIVSGNTYATIIMIAEKISDQIKEEYGIKLDS